MNTHAWMHSPGPHSFPATHDAVATRNDNGQSMPYTPSHNHTVTRPLARILTNKTTSCIDSSILQYNHFQCNEDYHLNLETKATTTKATNFHRRDIYLLEGFTTRRKQQENGPPCTTHIKPPVTSLRISSSSLHPCMRAT